MFCLPKPRFARHALDGPGGRLRDVAVKIQHPGVIDSAFMEAPLGWAVAIIGSSSSLRLGLTRCFVFCSPNKLLVNEDLGRHVLQDV